MVWEVTQKFADEFGFTLIDPEDETEGAEQGDTEVWVIARPEAPDDQGAAASSES